MRSAFALRIISGIIIYNFGVQESLRTFLNPIFTGRGRSQKVPFTFTTLSREKVNRENPQIFPVYKS